MVIYPGFRTELTALPRFVNNSRRKLTRHTDEVIIERFFFNDLKDAWICFIIFLFSLLCFAFQ